MREALMGVVRHAITTFGGALAASGLISADDLTLVAGAIATVVGVVWSILEKRWRLS